MDVANLLIKVLFCAVAVAAMSLAFRAGWGAASGPQADLVAFGILPFYVAGAGAKAGTFAHASLLACTLCVVALAKLALNYTIQNPTWRANSSPAIAFLVSYLLFEIILSLVIRVIKATSLPPLVQERYLVGTVVSNAHLWALLITLLAILIVGTRRISELLILAKAMTSLPEQVVIFGYSLPRVRSYLSLLSVACAAFSVGIFYMIRGGLDANSDARLMLLFTFVVVLASGDAIGQWRTVSLAIGASAALILVPYWLPPRYVELYIAAGLSVFTLIVKSRVRFMQQRGYKRV